MTGTASLLSTSNIARNSFRQWLKLLLWELLRVRDNHPASVDVPSFMQRGIVLLGGIFLDRKEILADSQVGRSFWWSAGTG